MDSISRILEEISLKRCCSFGQNVLISCYCSSSTNLKANTSLTRGPSVVNDDVYLEPSTLNGYMPYIG